MCRDNTATPCDEAINDAFRIAAMHPLIKDKSFGKAQLSRQNADPDDPPSWRAWWAEVRMYLSHLKFPPKNDNEALDEQTMHMWRQHCGTTGVPMPPRYEPAWCVYRELASPLALHRRPTSLGDDPRYTRMLDTPVGCYAITREDIEAFNEDTLEIFRYLGFVKARHRVRLAVPLTEYLTAYDNNSDPPVISMEENPDKVDAEQPLAGSALISRDSSPLAGYCTAPATRSC